MTTAGFTVSAGGVGWTVAVIVVVGAFSSAGMTAASIVAGGVLGVAISAVGATDVVPNVPASVVAVAAGSGAVNLFHGQPLGALSTIPTANKSNKSNPPPQRNGAGDRRCDWIT